MKSQDTKELFQELKAQNSELRSQLTVASDTEKRLRENIALEVSKGVTDAMVSHNLKLESLETANDKQKLALSRQKKRQANAIKDGISDAIKRQQSQIDQKEHQLQSLEERIEILQKTEAGLDKTVGYIQEHKSAIKKIHDATQVIAMEWHNVAMEGAPPTEVFVDWEKALKHLEDGVFTIRRYLYGKNTNPERSLTL